ncbi:MAG: cupin domain-containing protein, partial [Candidatus Latescibacterota bacterium]
MKLFHRPLFFALMLIPLLPVAPSAQAAQGPVEVRRLDSSPYTPGKDPDIDLYMGSWLDSQPRHTHGCLVERPALSKGDPAQPKQKGAVLRFVNRFSHATLYARNTTAPTVLKGEQEILYITGGKGSITAGSKTAELRDGIFVLIPEGVTFSMTNTGTEPLTLYLIAEPVTKTFKP